MLLSDIFILIGKLYPWVKFTKFEFLFIFNSEIKNQNLIEILWLIFNSLIFVFKLLLLLSSQKVK